MSKRITQTTNLRKVEGIISRRIESMYVYTPVTGTYITTHLAFVDTSGEWYMYGVMAHRSDTWISGVQNLEALLSGEVILNTIVSPEYNSQSHPMMFGDNESTICPQSRLVQVSLDGWGEYTQQKLEWFIRTSKGITKIVIRSLTKNSLVNHIIPHINILPLSNYGNMDMKPITESF